MSFTHDRNSKPTIFFPISILISCKTWNKEQIYLPKESWHPLKNIYIFILYIKITIKKMGLKKYPNNLKKCLFDFFERFKALKLFMVANLH